MKKLLFSIRTLSIFSVILLLQNLLITPDPPWFNDKIKTLIQAKNSAFNSFHKNSGNFELKRNLESLPNKPKSFH